MTSSSNPLDPVEQNRRARRIEGLYQLDGRDDPAHPQHGVYTGLWQAWLQQQISRLDQSLGLADGSC